MDDESARPAPAEVRAAWDTNAAFWDQQMEAGGTWQRTLIGPAVERLLDIRRGDRILEIACGNGEFARRMSELGASVLATDLSDEMLRHARARGGAVEYRNADATEEGELLALGRPGTFDAVVCNMAVMDMSAIEPMARASASLLKSRGRFVLSTAHPAFNGGHAVRMVEQIEEDRGVRLVHSIKVDRYITPSVTRGMAIEGQPVTHWYFNRPVGQLFDVWFRHGFVLDGLAEPVLAPENVPAGSMVSVFLEVPPVLVARLRLA